MKHTFIFIIALFFVVSLGCEEKVVLPEACFSVDANEVTIGTPIEFTSCSLNIDSLRWELGDGTIKRDDSFSYTYAEEGSYHVILYAFNKDGETEVTKTISVLVDLGNSEK